MTSKQILELPPDQLAKLPRKHIPTLVEVAIALDRELKAGQSFLSLLKLRLIHEAEASARAEGCEQTGSSWQFNDRIGETAEVTFPEDGPVRGIFFVGEQAYRYRGEHELVTMGPIKKLAGQHWDKLFFPTYKPCKAFRDILPLVLKPAPAAELLEELFEPSSPRVSFKTKPGE
jgi:hypothetical protein